MTDLFSTAVMFLLATLGLVVVIVALVVVWLAYRYNISFSISTKEKSEPWIPWASSESEGDKWTSQRSWENQQEAARAGEKSSEDEKG